jgi:hypothetical protein
VNVDLTVEELAELLRDAERAHGEYERELGARDDDWPTWYARYLLDRLSEPKADK